MDQSHKTFELNDDFFKKKELYRGAQTQKFATLEATARSGATTKYQTPIRRNLSNIDTRNHKNGAYSSFQKSPLYPRSVGFIDFGLQTVRPAFPINKVNEHRF